MTPGRLAWIAISSAAVAARGVAARRALRRRVEGLANVAEDGPDGAETGTAAAGVPAGELPPVPWIAVHAERLVTALVVGALAAAAAAVVARWTDRLPVGWEAVPLAATLVAMTMAGIYLMWKVPQWQAASHAAHGRIGERDLFEIENAARGTLGQILSGVAVVSGLLFAWQQLGNTSDNLQVSQEGQITDRFSRAVEQLGSDDPTVRIGGIYALDRISRDSERDHRPAMEVLAAFIRGSGEPSAVGAAATPVVTAYQEIEARAAFNVIARRDPARDGPGGCFNLLGARLSGIQLVGAELPNLCFTEARLGSANFTGADLSGVRLEDSDLTSANLSNADLVGTNLTDTGCGGCNFLGADLTGASLSGANLRGALFDATTVLAGADFNGATLDDAVMFGVDLSGVVALSQGQADAALTDTETRLPPGLENRPDFGG